MAKVHVCNVRVQNNPSTFGSNFEFEITFECLEDLPEDLEWKIIYVGSAESEDYDQILDTVYVGPVPEGRHKFVFNADPPDPAKIPQTDIVGVTVILLTCSYREQEFIRVGYYVSNEYDDPELAENPPEAPDFARLQRNILASNPRVTKFKINWEDPDAYKSPLEDENCPPIPNALPPARPETPPPSALKGPGNAVHHNGGGPGGHGDLLHLLENSNDSNARSDRMEF